MVHPRNTRPVTTYRELLDLAADYSAYMAARARASTLVPILANKSPDAIACSLGCLAAGRPFAWVNKRLRGPQIAEIVTATNTPLCIVDVPGLVALAGSITRTAELGRIEWLVLADDVGAGSATLLASATARLAASNVAVRRIELDKGARAPLVGIAPNEAACCLFTSGSTGQQKGVLIRESDLLARARSEVEWYALSANDRLMSLLPLSFDVGLNQLMSSLIAGASLLVQESWLPNDIARTALVESVTGISAVPAVWRDLIAAPSAVSFNEATIRGSLRYLAVSGGSLSVTEQERLQERARGAGIFKTYGQTESFRSASLRPAELSHRPGSVGRSYASARVLVLDDEQQRCRPGDVGEIVHIGLGTMLGYLGGAAGAPPKLRHLPAALGGELAVFTGDYGYLDDEGYLFLKGRRDGMIKISGNRVYPEEVAEQLRGLAAVREVEVLALDSAGSEPALVAFLSLQPVRATEAEIRKAAADRLPPYMMPARFVFLNSIPRLANGKTDRVALADRLRGTKQASA